MLTVIEKLQGYEAAAGAWESDILASRMVDYNGSNLDALSLGGEVVWGRLNRRPDKGHWVLRRSSLTRATPMTIALRDSLGWLLDRDVLDKDSIQGAAAEVLNFLKTRGASFVPEIVSAIRRLPTDVEEALFYMRKIESEAERIKKELSKAKKIVARAMLT